MHYRSDGVLILDNRLELAAFAEAAICPQCKDNAAGMLLMVGAFNAFSGLDYSTECQHQ